MPNVECISALVSSRCFIGLCSDNIEKALIMLKLTAVEVIRLQCFSSVSEVVGSMHVDDGRYGFFELLHCVNSMPNTGNTRGNCTWTANLLTQL